MTWLTADAVREDLEAKVRKVKARIERRRSSAADSYEFQRLATIVRDSLVAGNLIERQWFCDSVGMVWADGELDTCYITRSPVEAAFTEDNVVHWTHWIGRLATEIREYIAEHGRYPEKLKYGPPHRPELVRNADVGPWVRYKFQDGYLADYAYRDLTGLSGPAPRRAEAEAVPVQEVVPAPAFGLKDIVDLRDLTQDDQIRGPMAGTYILTGGPGVGKTSVALHRIPYLLLQQHEQLKPEVPDATLPFFRPETMQVVVWKEHLVQYLQKCLTDLHVGAVPVFHIEDWVARVLRDYVRIGRGKGEYLISQEPDELRRIKIGTFGEGPQRWTGLTEQMLATYLIGKASDNSFHCTVAEDITNRLASLAEEVQSLFEGHLLAPRFRLPQPGYLPTVAGIESAVQAIRVGLDELSEEINENLKAIRNPDRSNRSVRQGDARQYERIRPTIAQSRELVSGVRERLIEVLTQDYVALLKSFYGSRLVNRILSDRFGQTAGERFGADATKRLEDRRLSPCDRHLLLWVIHLLTRGGNSERAQAKPLKRYSHTMIDEAQYYHPLLLRLLVDLSMPPVNSVMIVGDLEQRVSSEGGLVAWDDAGIKVEARKIFRLTTNYRWSKAVFRFLDHFRQLTGLRELKEPRQWASGLGRAPVIVECEDDGNQVAWLVEQIAEIRRSDWSMAVVVPPTLPESWRQRVVTELASCDIRSRWAVGEDVRECQEQTILTDYDSIVGLEFDAVFLPSCDRVLTSPTPGTDAIHAAWVALTRSRRYVAVSHIGPMGIFDSAQFDEYRGGAKAV